MRRIYRSSIPSGATEVQEQSFDSGSKKSAFFFFEGEKVGFRQWSEDGRLEFEYGMRGGKKHGREYCFGENGQPYEVTPYRNGILHGTGIQWSCDGTVVISYTLINGTGLDMWCGHQNDTLSEEHYWPNDDEPGYHRNWNDDEKTINTEYYFFNGKGYHGVWREWNNKGKLRRGFPQYYINGGRVTKRKFIKACVNDASLPIYRSEDDLPDRNLPLEYLDQRKKPEV
jgi:antitoxin component YwqK of YwqJK toxin-antitoxin module